MDKILYFDAAASALKPQPVVEAQVDFLTNHYANSGRGVCARAGYVDDMIMRVRESVREFIGAARTDQIIFTSGTTDGMNRIANMIPADLLVAVSDLDHHSARLPFEQKFKTIVCPLDDNFDLTDVPKSDILVITAMSNVLGVPQDVKKIIANARKKNPNIITVVDAAQYVAHMPINVGEWDCDFLCFSGHKIGADTGVGIMYIREPTRWQSDKIGGGTGWMSADNKWHMDSDPEKFEAGTLPLTQIAGLLLAIQEISDFRSQSSGIVRYLYNELSKMPRVKLLTRPDAVMVSFVVNQMHVLDFGALMGAHNVCIRVGNMCASWIHKRFGIDGSCRISPGVWNTMDQAKQVVEIIGNILK